MAEITNEKRVLISPDRATLADYVANRFLRRIEKQIYDLEGEYLQVRTSRAERRGAGADASRWLTL